MALLHPIFSQLSEELWVVCDVQGNILEANERCEKILGWSGEELLHLFVPCIVHEEDAEFVRGILDAIREKIDLQKAEVRWRCKNGSYRDLVWNYVFSVPEQRIYAVGHDITAIKRYQAELIEAKEAALAATKAKTDFLANISHEIRTPMNSIMGMGELLAESELDEEQRQFISILNRAASSLLEVVNDVLDISRIESGQLQIETIPFNIRDVLEKALEIFIHKARVKNLSLKLNVDPAVPQHVIGDPHRLRQILINLIGNSMKFTEQGGIAVVVRAEQQRLLFCIEDTGIGMSEEQIHKLFQRFAQTDITIARKYGGSGLGLNISAQLVERMGGSMKVESKLGHGTVFTFELPLLEINKSSGQIDPSFSLEL